MLIVRSVNCIDAESGIVSLSKWPSGAQVERESLSVSGCVRGTGLERTFSQPVHPTATYVLRVMIPDAASIQFSFLMMSIQCSKHVEDYNKRIVK